MSDLIDTTEMYLRTVVELLEEGILPMRARIAERLGQSSPTVSQTVSRMERDGLLQLAEDRSIQLSELGKVQATRVMRRHRLAECMLHTMIKVPLSEVHDHACRWEHVLTDDVERRVFDLLDRPQHSPFGCPIPGLDELGAKTAEPFLTDVTPLATMPAGTWTVRRVGENAQRVAEILTDLVDAGCVPGHTIKVKPENGRWCLHGDKQELCLEYLIASDIFVEAAK